jgi:hypothetical protein
MAVFFRRRQSLEIRKFVRLNTGRCAHNMHKKSG